MAAFLIYSGLSTIDPSSIQGIHRFVQYSNITGLYKTDATHLTIDTPNFPTLPGNGFPTNGNPCGSGLTQAQENIRDHGPAHNLNFDGTAGTAWPASSPYFQMGGVNWATYTAGGKSADDFSTDIGEGARQFDGIDGVPNESIHPGNLQRDNINVILPSQYWLGGSPGAGVNQNGRRIHYEVNKQNTYLAILLAKIWAGRIGKMTSASVGSGILASYTNEQAASIWLSNGYGLEFLGAPYFATY